MPEAFRSVALCRWVSYGYLGRHAGGTACRRSGRAAVVAVLLCCTSAGCRLGRVRARHVVECWIRRPALKDRVHGRPGFAGHAARALLGRKPSWPVGERCWRPGAEDFVSWCSARIPTVSGTPMARSLRRQARGYSSPVASCCSTSGVARLNLLGLLGKQPVDHNLGLSLHTQRLQSGG